MEGVAHQLAYGEPICTYSISFTRCMVWWNPNSKKACGQSRLLECAKIFSHHLFTASLDVFFPFSVKGKDQIFLFFFLQKFLQTLCHSKHELQLWLCSTFFLHEYLICGLENCLGKANIIRCTFLSVLKSISRTFQCLQSVKWVLEELEEHFLRKIQMQSQWCFSC